MECTVLDQFLADLVLCKKIIELNFHLVTTVLVGEVLERVHTSRSTARNRIQG